MTPVRNPHQLLLVKHLYEDARLLSERDDALSLSKAVILLDLSIEQLLNHIVLSFDPDLTVNATKAERDVERKTLWGNAATCLKKKGAAGLTESREIANLHVLRNLVQHTGAEPARTEVKRYLGAAGAMMDNAFRDAYGLDFVNFRIWDLIGNEDLRRWLRESEDFLKEGNVRACVVGCVVAHGWILGAIHRQTKLRRMRRSIRSEVRGSEFARALNKVREELIKEIGDLENEVVAVGVGLPIMDTRQFLKYARVTGVFLAEAGNISIVSHGDPLEKDPAVANYMLEYLARLAQLVEDGYPGILDTIKVKIFPTEQEVWRRATA